MPYPNAYVEVDFDRGPYAFSGFVWTDVTSYVRAINITRGRTDELSNFESGNASIVLDNRDRRFDPFHATGPYYGKLLPRRHIRVRGSNGPKNFVDNASFEQSTSGWASLGTTITRSTNAYSGSYALQVTTSNAVVDVGVECSRVYVTAGQTYNFSAYFRNIAGATRFHRIDVQWWDSSSNLISTSTGTNTNVTAGGAYQRIDQIFTAPAGTFYGRILISIQGNNAAAGNVTLIDAAAVTLGGAPQTFAETYDMFRGFVEGWPVELTDAGYDSTVTVSCFDLLGLLADEEMPADAADWDIRNQEPRHYWPLTDPVNDTAGSTFVDYGYRPQALAPTGDASVANGNAMAEAITDTSLLIDWGADGVTSSTTPYNNTGKTGSPVSNGTIALWWEISDPTVSEVIFQVGFLLEVQASYSFANDRIVVDFYNGTNLYRYQTAVLNLDATIPHHLVVRYRDNLPTVAPSMLLDGVETTLTAVSTTASARTITEYARLKLGNYQQFAVFDSAKSFVDMKRIYDLSRGRYVQTTSARIGYLLNYTDVSSFLLSVPASPYGTVSDISVGGPALTAELQLVADSEGGNLYVTAGGILTMTSRYGVFEGRSLTNQATFGTGGISIGPIARYHYDADTMRNRLGVGVAGDATVDVEDASSISTYGVKAGTWTTQLSTVADAQTLGGILVGHYKNPTLTLEPFEVNVAAVAADWNTVLALELLDRITVTVPQRTGADLSTAQLIQQIQWSITPAEWTCQITGSTRFTNVFILDSSLLDGPDVLA